MLAPRRFADPETERIAASVQRMALAFGAAALVLAVALAFIRPPVYLAVQIDLGLFALLLVGLLLARAGLPRVGAGLLIGILYAAATISVFMRGQMGTALASFYVLSILVAALLLGSRAAVVTAALCMATGGGLGILEQRGLLVERVPYSPQAALWSQAVAFVVAAVLLRDGLGRLRAALARAERSEAESRALFEQASDGIMVLDRDGRVLDANVAACEITGRSREELLGQDVVAQLLGPEDQAAARSNFDALARGERVRAERRLRRNDGTTLVEISAASLSDGRVISILRDVSARRREQEMLLQLRAAMDQAEEGIAVFDRRGGLVYSNPAFATQYHGGGPVRPGVQASSFAWTERGSSAVAESRRALREGRIHHERFEVTTADGGRRILRVSVAPVRDPAGRMVASVTIIRDTTREAELEESVLRAQKVEAVGKLASVLAHDFNNLLTVLFGAAETLLESDLPTDEARLAAKEIHEAAERAGDLSRQLLGLSRHRQPMRRVLDLNAAVTECAGMLRRLVRENVRVSFRLAPGLGSIEADPFQIHQILLNLAANARDAMPDGGEVEIATAECEVTPSAPAAGLAPGPYVLLTVRDQGRGMEPEVRARMFEPFFTTKGEGQGTGLGLASVRSIVEQNGGAIAVESEPGRGTTIQIHFPRVAGAAGAHAQGSEPSRSARSARILLVEDDDVVRGAVLRALTQGGHRVTTARSGDEALSLAGEASRFDLLITDVIMPGIDGPTLAQRMRERAPELRILFTSGYAPDSLPVARLEQGRTDFLPKPFGPSELARKLEEMLGGGSE